MPHALSPQRDEHLRQLLARIGVNSEEIHAAGLALVDEALSHTSAGLQRNHEQLEFLGDAVLRLAASEYIERHHAGLAVGERSALRSHLVSDRWLAEVGQAIGISDVLRIGSKAGGDATAATAGGHRASHRRRRHHTMGAGPMRSPALPPARLISSMLTQPSVRLRPAPP